MNVDDSSQGKDAHYNATPSDDGSDPSSVDVQEWLDRIAKARNKERVWRERSKKIINLYRDDNSFSDASYTTQSAGQDNECTFNILFANTETLLPALFSSKPKPDVRNRYLNQDKIAETAGDVIERCLVYSMDTYSFTRNIKSVVKDHLLTGRGTARVRLIPHFENQITDDTLDEMGNIVPGSEQEVLVSQQVSCEGVDWDSIVIEPCKKWEDVSWIAFIHMLTKEEYVKYFPKAPLVQATKKTDEYSTDDKYKVYEIWHKTVKKVYYIGQSEDPLKIEDDPLKLTNFWPIPEPLYSIKTSNTLVPIPEYTLYQSQANEINQLSYRITDIIKSCKYMGVYDAGEPKIQQMLDSRDSEFVAITSNRMKEGGIEAIIDVIDNSQLAHTLEQLYAEREQAKEIIYEITGISDIIRGESKASETATAQNIKASYAGLRLRDRRDNINTFVVEILRIKAEIICRFFSPKELEDMSGIKLDYSQDQLPPPPPQPPQIPGMALSPQTMMAAQQAQLQYQMVMKAEMQKRQEAQQVLAVIKSDVLRNYKIDVESDSTILPDMNAESQKRAATVGAITQFLTAAAPLVMQGVLPMETAKALLLFALQPAKVSRELEDALELIGQAPPAPAPMPMSPNAQPQPQGHPPHMQNQGHPPPMPPTIQQAAMPPMPPQLR